MYILSGFVEKGKMERKKKETRNASGFVMSQVTKSFW